jgi:hypothetical protein
MILFLCHFLPRYQFLSSYDIDLRMTDERRIGIIYDDTFVVLSSIYPKYLYGGSKQKHQNLSQSNWSESETQFRNITAASNILNL